MPAPISPRVLRWTESRGAGDQESSEFRSSFIKKHQKAWFPGGRRLEYNLSRPSPCNPEAPVFPREESRGGLRRHASGAVTTPPDTGIMATSPLVTRTEKYVYEFDVFRVDPVRRRLLRGGEQVPLTPKAFAILLVLLERRGEVVEKEDLLQRIWPDTHVTEANLTQNVSSLRKALGERANDHRYVVTVPGRGYSFVAEILEVPREATGELQIVRDSPAPLAEPVSIAQPVPVVEPAPAAESALPPPPLAPVPPPDLPLDATFAPRPSVRKPRRFPLAGLVLGLLALTAIGIFLVDHLRSHSSSRAVRRDPVPGGPLTADRGGAGIPEPLRRSRPGLALHRSLRDADHRAVGRLPGADGVGRGGLPRQGDLLAALYREPERADPAAGPRPSGRRPDRDRVLSLAGEGRAERPADRLPGGEDVQRRNGRLPGRGGDGGWAVRPRVAGRQPAAAAPSDGPSPRRRRPARCTPCCRTAPRRRASMPRGWCGCAPSIRGAPATSCARRRRPMRARR